MAVPDEERDAIASWCAAQVPEGERARHRVGWSTHGADVTLVDRRAPARSEPGRAWTATPLARLRRDGEGRWTLHRPTPGGWRAITAGPDPVALLDDQTPDARGPEPQAPA